MALINAIQQKRRTILIFFISILTAGFGLKLCLDALSLDSVQNKTLELPFRSEFPSMPRYPPVFYAKGDTVEASVLFFEPSLYGNVMVFSFPDSTRCLTIDGSNQGCWDWRHDGAVTYVRDIRTFFQSYKKDVNDVLIVGLGAGSLLKEWQAHDLNDFKVDIVEINPRVIEAAEKLFVLPESIDKEIFIDDGRHFLQATENKYDIIILDLCEIVDSNVFLWTKEFYELAKSKLRSEEGVLIVTLNTFRSVDKGHINDLAANTLKNVFENVYAMDRHKYRLDQWGMIVFFASNQQVNILPSEDFPIKKWETDLSYGLINDENAFKTVQYYLPIFEKIRQETTKYFGLPILFGP